MSKALRGSSVDKLAHVHPSASHPLPAGVKSSPQIQRKIQNGSPKTSEKFSDHQSTPPASSHTSAHTSAHTSGSASKSQEQWIDGPRFHKSRMSRHHQLARTQRETWVDGPTTSAGPAPPPASAVNGSTVTYGFMDQHKQGMIRQWVETQSAQVSVVTSRAIYSSLIDCHGLRVTF